jgi:hypothetical protein
MYSSSVGKKQKKKERKAAQVGGLISTSIHALPYFIAINYRNCFTCKWRWLMS